MGPHAPWRQQQQPGPAHRQAGILPWGESLSLSGLIAWHWTALLALPVVAPVYMWSLCTSALVTPTLRQASQAALCHALQDADLLTTAIQEFGVDYPSLVGPFLTERDQYMVCTLRTLAGRYASVQALHEAWPSEIWLVLNSNLVLDSRFVCKLWLCSCACGSPRTTSRDAAPPASCVSEAEPVCMCMQGDQDSCCCGRWASPRH